MLIKVNSCINSYCTYCGIRYCCRPSVLVTVKQYIIQTLYNAIKTPTYVKLHNVMLNEKIKKHTYVMQA